ncbi:2-oxoglutarate dehydrogenase complex dihydrolipoyllysine-residue succinyltransferase [Hyphococcus flavus]|uniref:Dihydrolipoyllysine-residue succinyltransferase component of 2-oxoglutarate dehydrogenase complex n=1 Tax=Hyphococcus flavus TaxID=1866326 RepID=A0AAE9ZET2_9PROT|nr:2-oxoglutarate dehydrogenase complex dihydrolipoyllysine-residue succinyltransferase [Hyphococcus flavus]WDI32435.1 2-oxoglutarate dehydrogenase complex dihydrolipoyllysine-residue succinyltransferase [Hyphococcus flavus]
MATEIRVPTLGESVTEATIARWMKHEGDAVNADEPLVELETDKVSVEVPAPAAGVLASISAQEGDTVEVNALLGAIDAEASAAAVKPAPKEENEPAPASSGGGEEIEVRVPASGESVTEADIGEWLKKEGEAVERDEPIVSLETDKAAMDVPSPAAGVLKEIKVKEGETVEVGALIAIIEAGAAPSASAPKSNGAAAPSAQPASTASSDTLSPAPRRVVAERGLDASSIQGTGKGGRVTKADALSAETKPSQAKAPTPSATRDLGQREERVKMSRLRQTIARRLKEAQDTAAMLTTFNDVDMTAVMELRASYKDLFEKKHGIKLGFMSFFAKACVHALKEVPDVNAEIDGTDIIYKDHYDVGIAVGTDKGLVVPVVRDADLKSMAEIELEIADFGRRARSGDLKLEEMQGGTFTITNGGVYGSLLSTPILNQPQSGILGMHRIEQRPIARNGEVVIRPMMYLALSYDHRIVDGKGAVTFLVRLKENLEDPQRLLLDL